MVAKLLSTHDYLDLVLKYGVNPQSFLGSYAGYSYLKLGPETALAFIQIGKTLVSAGPPVGPRSEQEEALKNLRQYADQNKLHLLSVALSKSESELAAGFGFKKIMLGRDPFFDLPSWTSKLSAYPAAKKLLQDGAKVQPLKASEMTSDQRREFEQLRKAWLKTRKIPPLGFLNQVKLWDRGIL